MRAADATAALGFNASLAGPAATVAAQLKAVGASLVREPARGAGEVAKLAALRDACAAIGVRLRINLGVVAYLNEGTTWQQQKAGLMQAYALGCVESVEGVNEMNNVHLGRGSHGVEDRTLVVAPSSEAFRAWAAAISAFVRANMPGVKVYSPTIIGYNAGMWAANAARVSDLVDAGAFHYYPSIGGQPSNLAGHGDGIDHIGNLPSSRHWAADVMMGDKLAPMTMTETGAAMSSDPVLNKYVDERTGAILCLALYLDALKLGVSPIMFYRLADLSPQKPGDPESYFGFYNPDGTPKLAATVFARVAALLKDDASGTPLPAPPITVTGMDNTVGGGPYEVFSKNDGSFVIAVWHEPLIYNVAGGAITPPVVNVTVSWDVARPWARIDVLNGVTIASGSGTSCVLPLAGYAQFIKLGALHGTR